MDITTTHRSHWVDSTGRRYASQWKGGKKIHSRHPIHGLQPILNLDEVREFVRLGRIHLPGSPSVPDGGNVAVWYMQRLLDYPKTQSAHTISEICGELTDSIPIYAEQWRAPFVAMRELWPAVETVTDET